MIHPLRSVKAHIQNYRLKHFRSTCYGRYMVKIHNSHLGESCFVIGNGPSLSAADLEVLHQNKIDTFAVNRIFKIFPETAWRPTYYVNTDHVMIRDILDEINGLPVMDKFIALQNRFYNGSAVKGAHCFFANYSREKDQPEGFSLDCTDQVNIRGTVTIDCIQLAMHMGYRQIYLLGVDHNFNKVITESGDVVEDPDVKNYFCENYDSDVINEVVHDLGNTTRAYEDVRRFCDANGVQVINVTRTTKLEAFKKENFEDAILSILKHRG